MLPRRICAAAEHYDADNTDAMPLTGFQGAEMHPAVFADQLKRCFHVSFTGQEKGATLANFKPLLSRSFSTRFG